jgi:DNA-binding response OmpR family regulator
MSRRGLEHLIPFDLDLQCEDARILVIDDEPLITRFVALTLNRAGFANVDTTNDPLTVPEILPKRRPDLIVLDLEMPSQHGLELLREIRANPNYEDISVIILSGSDKANKYRSLKLGAVDFIDKPVDSDDLEIRIRRALRVV